MNEYEVTGVMNEYEVTGEYNGVSFRHIFESALTLEGIQEHEGPVECYNSMWVVDKPAIFFGSLEALKQFVDIALLYPNTASREDTFEFGGITFHPYGEAESA